MAGRPQVSDPRRVSAPTATAPSPAEGAYGGTFWCLAALTHTLVVGMPMMSLPVLFDEIGTELSLNLVQIGYVWGAASLPGRCMSLTGGVIGDHIGARADAGVRLPAFGGGWCNAGVCQRLHHSDRNCSDSRSLPDGSADECPQDMRRVVFGEAPGHGEWRCVGGHGLGISAGIANQCDISFAAAWRLAERAAVLRGAVRSSSVRCGRSHDPGRMGKVGLLGQRTGPRCANRCCVSPACATYGLLALAMFGIGGAIQGSLGYLPLYLRNEGWEPGAADSALASFHFASLLFTVPFALLSDRLGVRRPLLLDVRH